jgi:ribosomal protein S18
MNFYQLHNLLTEYGQGLIQTLIEKFQKEQPGLTSIIIKSYIDRFERIKDNLPEKDIQKYNWKNLENTVDGYQTKDKIKAGKLDPTVSDANLLYHQNKVRIYLGKDKKSCIKYGNGYSFCISARGSENMYSHYRINQKGTPYFIFNDNLPPEDNRHLMVLFVYDKSALGSWAISRYSLTLASNRPQDEKEYEKLEDITQHYPWIKPIENFVDDKNKGTVDVEPFEVLEHYLTASFDFKNQQREYKSDYHMTAVEIQHLVDILNSGGAFLKNYKKLQDLLNDDDKNVISMNVARRYKRPDSEMLVTGRKVKFDEYETFGELTDDLIKVAKQINDQITERWASNEHQAFVKYKDVEGLNNFIKTNEKIKDVFEAKSLLCTVEYPAGLTRKMSQEIDTYFSINLFSKNWIKQYLKISTAEGGALKNVLQLHIEYQSDLNWLKQRTPEQMKMILNKMTSSQDAQDAQDESLGLIQVDKVFAYFKKLF